MDVIVERCAGLDVHRDSVVATVRVPGKGKSRRRRAQQTRTFATTIAQLEQLADWLEGFGVTLVGMEATGVYWKPLFWVLERRFECWLINAEHLHNVPGRKSDVIDSRWCCELLELGLVRPSFVPPPEIRRLRDLTRLRSTQVEERTRAIQRLEKVLQDAGIKLTSVASGTYSVSARTILEALLGGLSDPAALAQLAKGRLRAKIPQLEEALASRFDTAHHGVLVAGLLAHIDALEHAVATLDARTETATAADAELVELLCTIPGVKLRTAQVLIAECGIDMSVFGSGEHLVSWAAICPGTNQSGHRRRSGKTRHGNPWLRTALTQAAHAAARTKNTYLASHYWQIRGRRGDAKAIGATRHDILIAYYHIVNVHRKLLEREGDKYGPGTRAVIEAGRDVDDERYEGALADRQRVAEGFRRALGEVDVLAGPTVAYPAPHEDPPVGTPQGEVEARFTGPYNLAGLPAVSVPCGLAEGPLPAGLQLAAAAGEDAVVLSVAAALERLTA